MLNIYKSRQEYNELPRTHHVQILFISIKFINKDINYGIFGRKSVARSYCQILQILDNQISPSFFLLPWKYLGL